MTLQYAVSSEQHDALKRDRDKLLAIVEMVAIGTSWAEFKKLYDEYKAGESLSVLNDRLEFAYSEGFKFGMIRGEQLALDKDIK